VQTERCMIHLDDNIYVVAKLYDEALQIHISQYIQFGDKLYPTKKRVVLNLSKWLLLEVNLDKIDQHVKSPIDDRLHLGGSVFVCLNSPYTTVNIRHFWKPVGATQTLPTKRGIVLKKSKLGMVKTQHYLNPRARTRTERCSHLPIQWRS
jgi:hypothetical protein